MQPILKVQALSKTFKIRDKYFLRKKFQVLDNISFCLAKGETIAIIGETGSGKSTLAKILAGAEISQKGQILLEGNIIEDDGKRKTSCRDIRLIFQDASKSLNPGITIGKTLKEILLMNTDFDDLQCKDTIDKILLKVGLLAEHQHYYPHMFSGGQLQRVALARALILEPKVLVLDEALSSLDPSVRAQTVNLLLKLQQETGLSYVLITHHLSLVKHMSDQTLVLDQGKVIESGKTLELFKQHKCKVTQRLLNC